MTIKERFKQDIAEHVESGAVTRTDANDVYTFVTSSSDILPFMMLNGNNGHADSFWGFAYIQHITDLDLADYKIDCDRVESTHQGRTAHHDIFLICAEQRDDDWMNYDSPRGEDTYHYTVLFAPVI